MNTQTVELEKDGKVVARHGVMKVEQPDGKVVEVPCVDRRSKKADDRMQRKLRARGGSPTAMSDAIPDNVNPGKDKGTLKPAATPKPAKDQ